MKSMEEMAEEVKEAMSFSKGSAVMTRPGMGAIPDPLLEELAARRQEVATLHCIIESFAARIVAQSEIIARFAEKKNANPD